MNKADKAIRLLSIEELEASYEWIPLELRQSTDEELEQNRQRRRREFQDVCLLRNQIVGDEKDLRE